MPPLSQASRTIKNLKALQAQIDALEEPAEDPEIPILVNQQTARLLMLVASGSATF